MALLSGGSFPCCARPELRRRLQLARERSTTLQWPQNPLMEQCALGLNRRPLIRDSSWVSFGPATGADGKFPHGCSRRRTSGFAVLWPARPTLLMVALLESKSELQGDFCEVTQLPVLSSLKPPGCEQKLPQDAQGICKNELLSRITPYSCTPLAVHLPDRRSPCNTSTN